MGKSDEICDEQRAALNAELTKDIPRFMDKLFGPGNWQFDAAENLYIARDPNYSGPGFGFVAVRPDGSYFTGVRRDDVLQ
jgi:hypothetical protein